jgi:hypothetical protein
MLTIASAMICQRPRKLCGRLILSAYDGVWDAIREIPASLRPYVTDDLGNRDVVYGGFLQIIDGAIFPRLEALGLFACFRLVDAHLIDALKVEPLESYAQLRPALKSIGWDIFTGTGWMSAATDGLFPIDTDSGCINDLAVVNRFGLIDSEEECRALCEVNNREFPSWAPWNPVAVSLDSSSYTRLSVLTT